SLIASLLNVATRSGGSSDMIDAACRGPTYPSITSTSLSVMCSSTLAACLASIDVNTFATRFSDATTAVAWFAAVAATADPDVPLVAAAAPRASALAPAAVLDDSAAARAPGAPVAPARSVSADGFAASPDA